MANNMIIGQSGGPTAVINASLAGALEYAFGCDEIDTVYGMVHGIQGLLEDNVINLTEHFAHKPSRLNRLSLTPAMFLGSCRFKLSQKKDEYEQIIKELKKYDISYFFYIGGNDSMDTVEKLSQYVAQNNIDIKVVGIPKTIDNDLMGIDHSPGFASAAKYVPLLSETSHMILRFTTLNPFISSKLWAGMQVGLRRQACLQETAKTNHLILSIFPRCRLVLKGL